jgi:hypothetical protein
MSAVFKLDNCLLWCNPDLYPTISRYFVLVVLSLVLLAVDCHLSKLNGFLMSSGLLRSASMELSPIGWQSWDLCLSAPPPKRQTFLSVADKSRMSAQHVGNILLCRPIFWLSVSCRGILLPTHFPICKQEPVLVWYVLLLLHA